MTARRISPDGLPLDKYGMDKYGRFYDHLDDPEEKIGEDGEDDESYLDTTPRMARKWRYHNDRRELAGKVRLDIF